MELEGERCAYASQNEHLTHKVRVKRLASGQCGQVTRAQLRTIGVAPATIARWIGGGYLIPTLPHVYAVGHLTDDQPTRLFSLALFAGPLAALSHGTAAHWRGWLRYPVKAIHVSTPRQIRTKLPGVLIHCRRELDRELVDGIPCTTITQTLLDVAATEPDRLIHRCLAQLDYERKLNRRAILEAAGRGRIGSARLLKALDTYMPQLAHTKSELEDEFLYLCRRAQLPLPLVNPTVHGIEPDCYWPDLRLVVELDGGGNHGTGPQRTRDQRRAMILRAHGIDLIRYTEDQVFFDAGQVTADLRREIARRSKGSLAA